MTSPKAAHQTAHEVHNSLGMLSSFSVPIARQVLGKRLGKGMGAAAEAIKRLTTDDIVAYEANGTITVGDLELKEGELKVRPGRRLMVRAEASKCYSTISGGVARPFCDPRVSSALYAAMNLRLTRQSRDGHVMQRYNGKQG